MDGATVSAGDDDALAGLFLEVIEEVDEDGIDGFFAVDDGEAVAAAPFTIGEGGWVGGVDEGGIEGAPFTAEEIFGDAGQVGLRFPWIGGPRRGGGGRNAVKDIVLIPIDGLPFAVEPPDLFPFRFLHAGTGCEKNKCD